MHAFDNLWVENFDEITLSRTVKEIEANLCFAFLAEIRKFKMAAIFGEGKIFWKIAKIAFLRYPVGRKFQRNRSISHGYGDRRKFVFCIFGKNSKIQNGRHFWGENFDEIALSRTVKEIEANLCFAIFGKNSKIQNGCHFWGGENFWKIAGVHSLDTLWVENFDEIALSRTVKEIEANLCFAIFGKNSKIQNGRHFWGGENFWKIAKIRYPVGRKFRRNHSISHS